MRGNLKIVKTSSDGNVKGFAFRITGANGYDIILETCLLYTSKVRQYINPSLRIDGILLNIVDNRTNLAKSTADAPVSYTHLDVYKRQALTNLLLAGVGI